MYRLAPLFCSLLLCACSSPQPYRAESLPLPPAPVPSAEPDLSAYPAAPRDYASYRSWGWKQPPASTTWASSEQIEQSIAEGLDQRGLRPARDNPADLLVQAQISSERRVRVVQDYPDYGFYGGYGGGPWGHHHGHHHGHYHGIYAQAPMVRHQHFQVLQVEMQLIEVGSGELVWQGAGEALDRRSQSGRMEALREAIQRSLQDYPPN